MKGTAYLEFFWTVFSSIWTEYGEIPRISPYSVRRRENMGQKNSEYGHFFFLCFCLCYGWNLAHVTSKNGEFEMRNQVLNNQKFSSANYFLVNKITFLIK